MVNILKLIAANVNTLSVEQAKDLVFETRALIRDYDEKLERTGQKLEGELPEGYHDYREDLRYGVTVLSMLVGKAYDYE